MADDMEKDKRKTHVERFYGKDESKEGGPDNSDFWIDVEVLDRLIIDGFRSEPPLRGSQSTQWSMRSQQTVWHLLEEREKMEKRREFTEKKVKNPDDKEQYVTIKVWDQIHSTEGLLLPGSVKRNYSSGPDPWKPPEVRKVEVRKVVHRGIDDRYLKRDAKDGKDKPPRDPEEYWVAIKKSADKDEDVYLNVEFTKEWKTRRLQGLRYQETRVEVELDISKLIPPEGKSDKKADPVRLDPMQWIVNVGFEGLAAEFGDKAEDAPGLKST